MALDTAPSFGGGNTLSSQVAKQRMQPRPGGMGKSAGGGMGGGGGMSRGATPMTGGIRPSSQMLMMMQNGAGSNPLNGRNMKSIGGPSPMSNMGGPIASGPGPGMRIQGDPLMSAPPMGGGMVANNAPPMMGGGFNDKAATGGERALGGGFAPPAPMDDSGGGMMPPTNIMSRYRNMDPRFRY